MTKLKITSDSPESTMKMAQKLAKELKSGDIICLIGDLGCGKTTFVKGLAKGLRIKPKTVHSPTFVLMNMYEGKLPLYHFDLYRTEGLNDIQNIGYEEFLYGDGVAVIEWGERIEPLLQNYLEIKIDHKGELKRLLEIVPKGKRYSKLLKKI